MAITDAWLKANYCREIDKAGERTDRDNLSVRISTKGKLTWQIRYRFGGSPKRVKIGSYPKMTLKQARSEAIRLMSFLEQGKDPAYEKKAQKIRNATEKTLKEVIDLWYEAECVVDTPSSAPQIYRTLEIHVMDKYGDILMNDIERATIISLIEGISKKAPQIAQRVLTQLKKIYRWAYRREIANDQLISDLTAAKDFKIKKGVTKTVLNDDELFWLWEQLRGSRMAMKTKCFTKLVTLYACRVGELRLSKKSDFDLQEKIWTVPPENHKTGGVTGDPILRPIPSEFEPLIIQAMDVSPSNQWMFVNGEGSGSKWKDEPWGQRAVLSPPYHIREWIRKHLGEDMKHWSYHDLRRTARTRFSTITDPHIAEMMLAHKLPGMQAVYDHHKYIDEMSEAYSAWHSVLGRIVGGI